MIVQLYNSEKSFVYASVSKFLGVKVKGIKVQTIEVICHGSEVLRLHEVRGYQGPWGPEDREVLEVSGVPGVLEPLDWVPLFYHAEFEVIIKSNRIIYRNYKNL